MSNLVDVVSENEQGEGLEPLVFRGVYEAELIGLSENRGTKHGPNPLVRIINPNSPEVEYYGSVIFSTNPTKGGEANNIRDSLTEEREGFGLSVKVLGLPRSKKPEGPYRVVGTYDPLHIPPVIEEITAKEALAVLQSECVFYAQYLDIGSLEDPFMVAYDKSGLKKTGFLDVVERRHRHEFSNGEDYRRNIADSLITDEICSGVEPGSRLIVKHITATDSGQLIFVPVINFYEDDDVYFGNIPLVTKAMKEDEDVTGMEYKRGDIIYNLPILSTAEPKNPKFRGKMFGVGRIKRPDSEDKKFYYKHVFVLDAENDVGKYVTARIENNGDRVIRASRVSGPLDLPSSVPL